MSKQSITSSSKFNSRNVLISAVMVGFVGTVLLIFTHAATPNSTTSSPVSTLAAGSASYSLVPQSGTSINTGTEFSANINESSGSQLVNTIDVKLSYDANKLDFVAITNDAGPLNTCFENGISNGLVSLVCTKLGGTVSGDNLKVGKVTFRTKSSTGNTSVSFASTSHIYVGAAVEIWNGNASAMNITVSTTATPPPPPPPSPNPNPNPNPTPKPTPSPTPTPSGGTTPSPKPTPSPTPTTPGTPPPVTPNPTDPNYTNQNTEASYLVAIKIVDSSGKPVSNATVEIGAIKAKTDTSGIANFENLKAGKYKVTVTSGAGSATKDINVLGVQTENSIQSFDIKVNNTTTLFIEIGLGIVGLIALVVGAMFLKKKMAERSMHNARFAGNSNDVLFTHEDTAIDTPPTIGGTPTLGSTVVKPQPPSMEAGTELKTDVIKPSTPASTTPDSTTTPSEPKPI